MYQQFNEQFAAASRQFADTAAQINRLALDNATKVFGLQLSAFEQGANATLAFLGEVAEVRDAEQLKTVWPKGLQIARENAERAVSIGQEVFGRTLKTNEAIGQIAKGQFEAATAQAQDNVKTVADNVVKAAKAK